MDNLRTKSLYRPRPRATSHDEGKNVAECSPMVIRGEQDQKKPWRMSSIDHEKDGFSTAI